MEIVKNTPSAIVVSSQWRHFGGVNQFLGRPDHEGTQSDGSSLIQAHILDANDRRGLWIELNSNRKWPDHPIQNLFIPWQYVLAIVLQPDLKPSAKDVGFPKPLSKGSVTPEGPVLPAAAGPHLS